MPAIDNLMVFRCVQVVRRLSTKNREVGLFCNMSASTLANATCSRRSPISSRPTACSRPIWCSSSRRARCARWGRSRRNASPRSPISASASRWTTWRTCAWSRASSPSAASASSRCRPRCCSAARAPQGDIHPADFSDLLGRFGIDLIAEKIESEGTVVDLLDYDVRFGQGFLFSPPRPVRTEVLQGIAERPARARAARLRRRARPSGRRRRWRTPTRRPSPAGPRPARHRARAARARHRAARARR